MNKNIFGKLSLTKLFTHKSTYNERDCDHDDHKHGHKDKHGHHGHKDDHVCNSSCDNHHGHGNHHGQGKHLVGGPGDDVLIGTSKNDKLVGGPGDDTLKGGKGNDKLVGGPGDDTLKGGKGNDKLVGSSGDDTLNGGNGNDKIVGSAGDDCILPGAGSDTVKGSGGNDTVVHLIESDSCAQDHYHGGGGFDTLVLVVSEAQALELAQKGVEEAFEKVAGTGKPFDFGKFHLSFNLNIVAQQFEKLVITTDYDPNKPCGCDDQEPKNNPPVAVNDAFSTAEGIALVIGADQLLGNDSDPDGDPLNVSSFTQPSHGSITQNPDGSLTYTPDADFHGTDSFTYIANDGMVNSNPATVTIMVNPVNDPPVAVNDAFSTDEDVALVIGADQLLGNDSDPDGDPLNVSSFTQPSNGSITQNPDGSLTYTPDADFTGTDSFTYIANDGTADSNEATVVITVNPVNDPPVAVNDAFSTDEDVALVIGQDDLLGNDSDPDGDPLNVSSFTQPSNGSITQNPDGSLTYTPDADFHGTDSFTYIANDGTADSNEATVVITVNPVNDPPIVTGEVRNAITLNTIDNGFNLAQDANVLIETLSETQALDDELVINDLGLIRISSNQTIDLYFQNEGAGYQSSIGWYKVADDGTIYDVQMIWPNASVPPLTPDTDGSNGYDDGSHASINVSAGDMIGFFLAPNAFSQNNFNNFDTSQGHFAFLSSNGTEVAHVTDVAPKLYFVSDMSSSPTIVNTAAGGGVAWHSAAIENDDDFGDLSKLNADDNALPEGHVFSASTQDGLALMGFEDLNGGGDRDYNDVTFFVDLGPEFVSDITQLVDITVNDPDNDPIVKAVVQLQSSGNDKLNIDQALLDLLNDNGLTVTTSADNKTLTIEGQENGVVSYLDFLDTYLIPNQGGLFVELEKDANGLPVSNELKLFYTVDDNQQASSNTFEATIPIVLPADAP